MVQVLGFISDIKDVGSINSINSIADAPLLFTMDAPPLEPPQPAVKHRGRATKAPVDPPATQAATASPTAAEPAPRKSGRIRHTTVKESTGPNAEATSKKPAATRKGRRKADVQPEVHSTDLTGTSTTPTQEHTTQQNAEANGKFQKALPTTQVLNAP